MSSHPHSLVCAWWLMALLIALSVPQIGSGNEDSGWIHSRAVSERVPAEAADEMDGAKEEFDDPDAPEKSLERVAYPLTIVGMVLTTLAIGHLLSVRPSAGDSPHEIDDSPETLKTVGRSLGLVLILSLLDLVWTILASQADQMRELNPLGSRLIEDPVHLIIFKVVVTCSCVGLLFALRRYRRAQLAAWWACLICTLLAVRWLVFNSMFVA